MPAALTDTGGEAEKVEVKVPRGMKASLKALLAPGETISDLTRRLWADEIARQDAGAGKVKAKGKK